MIISGCCCWFAVRTLGGEGGWHGSISPHCIIIIVDIGVPPRMMMIAMEYSSYCGQTPCNLNPMKIRVTVIFLQPPRPQ